MVMAFALAAVSFWAVCGRGGRRKARVGAFQRINVTPPRTTGQSNPGRTLVLLGKTATANMQPFAAALRKPTGTGRTLKTITTSMADDQRRHHASLQTMPKTR